MLQMLNERDALARDIEHIDDRSALVRDIAHIDDRIERLQLLRGQEAVISALTTEQVRLRGQLVELELRGSSS